MSIWTRKCAGCGGEFLPRRWATGKYCSGACRQKAYRERKAAEAKAKPRRKRRRT